MAMTQQYLAGEMSLLLWQLQVEAASQPVASDVAKLRREAETLPVNTLTSVATRAIRLTDTLCWDSLARGDVAAFHRQAAASAALHEFGVCAGLLRD